VAAALLAACPAGAQVERYTADSLSVLVRRAEQGDAQARFEAGGRYYFGRGTAIDFAEAARWWRLAALQEHARSQTALAFLFRDGKGVAADDAEAVTWLKRAARQGDPIAQLYLGLHYHEGRGVARDDAEAFRLWDAAATGRYPYAAAQFRLARAYVEGTGTAVDLTKAIKWMTEAAERNYVLAQVGLGVLYGDEGKPVVNYAEAYKWLRIAEIQIAGMKNRAAFPISEEAVRQRQAWVVERLSAEEVVRIDRSAGVWRPRDQYFPGLDPFPPH
jgi:hypothetical protein